MRGDVPFGTFAANAGARRHAAARVCVRWIAYLRLSRNERSRSEASTSVRTSAICRAGSAPGASSALVALATSLSENGPARSKKPGCSIQENRRPGDAPYCLCEMPSAGFEPIRAPLLALGPGTSELCRRAEAEELLLVVGLFGEDL